MGSTSQDVNVLGAKDCLLFRRIAAGRPRAVPGRTRQPVAEWRKRAPFTTRYFLADHRPGPGGVGEKDPPQIFGKPDRNLRRGASVGKPLSRGPRPSMWKPGDIAWSGRVVFRGKTTFRQTVPTSDSQVWPSVRVARHRVWPDVCWCPEEQALRSDQPRPSLRRGCSADSLSRVHCVARCFRIAISSIGSIRRFST
jgi:hypothetical protein